MWHGSSEIGETLTAKDTEVRVLGVLAEQEQEGCGVALERATMAI